MHPMFSRFIPTVKSVKEQHVGLDCRGHALHAGNPDDGHAAVPISSTKEKEIEFK